MSIEQRRPKALISNVEVLSDDQVIVHVTLFFDDYTMGFHPTFNANEFSSDTALRQEVVNQIKKRWDKINNLKFMAKEYYQYPLDW